MKIHSIRNPLVSCKEKVMPFAALTFFLCLYQTQAQLNISDSSIYNGNSNSAATAINLQTTETGAGNLDVLNPSTASISIAHDVAGYIHIDNEFDAFRIESTESLTSGITPALSIDGGTNLSITGGSYSGGAKTVFSNDWNGAIGGLISGTATTVVSGATFTGGTLAIKDINSGGTPPLPGQTNSLYQTPVSQGADGLYVENSHLLLFDDTSAIGGNGSEADSTRKDAYASGGNGLTLMNSSAVISNGIYRGGNGGNTEVSTSYSGFAQGGYGLYASNSTAIIHSGTFSGGLAGEVNGETASGGSGLIAIDGSSITNIGGSFTGSSGTAAVQIHNSDFTSMGGFYTGGLLSSTTGSESNTLNFLGGAFDSISLMNASSNGMQFITASNIVVSAQVYQQGGTVEINNIEDAAFKNLVIDSGSMVFTKDLTLTGSLALNSANSVAIFQGLDIDNNATVDLGIGRIEAADAFNLMSGAELNITILTNQSGSITAGTAHFSTNSTLLVDASAAGFSSGSVTNTFLSTTSGPISGFNTNDVLTEVQVSNDTNVLGRTTFGGFELTANDLSAIFNTAALSDYWDATGDLAVLAEELEVLASAEMNAIINNLGPDASKEAIQETYFSTMNTFQVAKQGLDTAVGLSLSRGTEFRDQLRLPTGAKGPDGGIENDWRFWAKYYGNFYHRNQDGLNPEYDAIMQGGVIGMDKSFGNLLVGLSGGMGRNTIESENDAEQNMDSYQGALYSTLGKNHAYLDAGLAYGFNEIESRTADPFTLKGEFDTHLISAHLGGGYGFEFKDIGTIITPEAAIRYTAYQQQAYTETGTTAVPRSFNEFDANSLLGTFGLNAAMLNSTAFETFAFKLEGRAHWMHEFNPEPGTISYQLVGGASDYVIAYPYLDEDTIRLGFGFTFFNTMKQSKKNILLRLDFDELFGKDFNSHNLSAKAIFAF